MKIGNFNVYNNIKCKNYIMFIQNLHISCRNYIEILLKCVKCKNLKKKPK